MGFPVPGDVIEQSLDLNRYLIRNPAATFLMRVTGDMVVDTEVQPGDLLVVDRSRSVQGGGLVVSVMEGQLLVLRVELVGPRLVPAIAPEPADLTSLEIWGAVTNIIRAV
ncbi:S24 family peptidase [Leptolyngbya iicbica]|uniref:DNA repair protein n=2 Tax=Cyanophyceae TaxID=3028117 RepID=A0A4Q7EFV9_9CYAN|nr:S24 family peptidase [Leptolyngbya sp. LK]RZM82724.1 DNA repair protein [Leptolyngbya sp. LK]